MNDDSLTPRQCSALTAKGWQCRKQAIIGGTVCNKHAESALTHAGTRKVAKLGDQIFFETVLQIGMQSAIDKILGLCRAGVLNESPLFAQKRGTPLTLIDLGLWYDSLDPASREQTQEVLLRCTGNKRTSAAGLDTK
jgi:hypothetical protein